MKLEKGGDGGGGGSGPLGPQRRFSLSGLSRQAWRPDHGENSADEEEEKDLVLKWKRGREEKVNRVGESMNLRLSG